MDQMRAHLILTLTLLVPSTLTLRLAVNTNFTKIPSCGVDESNDNKIYGGHVVQNMKEYPYMVSIHMHGEHSCGGGLITLDFVVTACHCLADIMDDKVGFARPLHPEAVLSLTFLAGSTNIILFDSHGQIRRAKSIHYHPKCQVITNLIYDHGLAQMQDPFLSTPYVKPMKPLAWSGAEFEKVFAKRFTTRKKPHCEVAGWGSTRKGVHDPEVPSDVLKAAKLSVMTNNLCGLAWRQKSPALFDVYDFWSNGQICVRSCDKSSDCVGDSGSPFVCDGSFIATVSYGTDDCSTGSPSVYATAARLLDWIRTEFAGEFDLRRRHLATASPREGGTQPKSRTSIVQSPEASSSNGKRSMLTGLLISLILVLHL